MKSNKVYLSLGGNIGNVQNCLKEALSLLCSNKNIANFHSSHFYLTSPVGMISQHDFINTACCFETTLSLSELFCLTQSIEQKLGKVEKPKNSDRPIDIDILFFGNDYYENKEITIPHPRWKERLFVLIPLQELTKTITLSKLNYTETIILQELIDILSGEKSSDSVTYIHYNSH
jgi:2-amino-4-hydroxy-6-hydroxymethyldihydropteridine diphosphokinase